jgi:hypothetical protein
MRRMASALAIRCASTFQGTFVSSAVSPSTGSRDAEARGIDRVGAGMLRGEELTEHGAEIVVVQRQEGLDGERTGRSGSASNNPSSVFRTADVASEQHLLLTSLQFSFILSAVPSRQRPAEGRATTIGRLFAFTLA